jgi:PB1 domain
LLFFSFIDLNKKIEDLIKLGEIVIKYRIMDEDLDTLVSIRCNDDLVHMWDEYDRLLSLSSLTTSAPRFLRLFLFPSFKSPSFRPCNYLDAINGQQIDPTSNCQLDPSRDHHHTESLSFCHVDNPSERHVELLGANRVVSSLLRKQFHRVWSTPNLHGACQAGGDGVGPSSRIQCGNIYQSHVQLGHSHQQTFGRSETCRCGNMCAHPLQKVERPPIRVASYHNLNLACQMGLVVSDQSRSNQVQSPSTIGNGVQNPVPNNLAHINTLQTTIINCVGVHKLMQNDACMQNSIPNGSSEQNLIQSYADAFGSAGTMATKHMPLEVGSCIYVQHPGSGSATPVGRQSRSGTPVSDGC